MNKHVLYLGGVMLLVVGCIINEISTIDSGIMLMIMAVATLVKGAE